MVGRDARGGQDVLEERGRAFGPDAVGGDRAAGGAGELIVGRGLVERDVRVEHAVAGVVEHHVDDAVRLVGDGVHARGGEGVDHGEDSRRGLQLE